MKKFSLLIVYFAVGMKIALAQSGYNYDRPDVNLAAGGARPPTGAGFQGSQGGYPAAATTPTYAAPSFPSSQGASAPGSGYNYPSQADTGDFPTGPSGGTTGYPQAGQPQGSQRPSTAYGPPSAAAPSGSFGGPSAGAPAFGGPAAGGAFPGQAQRPGTVAAAAGPQAGFGPSSAGGFNQGALGGGSGFAAGAPAASPAAAGPSGQQDENQEGDYSAIPGEPEIDYPIFSEIPETSFDCSQQEFPGYYADVEARCQVFHICALNKTFDFLCPNGTIFSQETLVCVWWNQFDCNSAPGLYGNNANLYDNSQTGGQAQGQGFGPGAQGAAGVGPSSPGVVANDFAAGSTGPYPAAGSAVGGSTGPYPAPGRPQQPPTSFGSTGPSAPYPAGGAAGSSYQPSGPSSTGGAYQPPQQQQPSAPGQYPSTPYPSAGANVPSSYQPPQSDTAAGYPAAGVPQTQATPNRDYLPPRRG